MPIDGAADSRWSVISSLHDQAGPPDALLDLALRAARVASETGLADLEERSGSDARWIRTWPGEHYRLLAALAAVVGPASIVEVGTFKGQGALALAATSRCPVVTYDLTAWPDIPGAVLTDADLVGHGGRIEQRLGDLGDAGYRASQLDTLRAADLIFVDGPKDGEWEQHAVPDLLGDLGDRRRLVVLDDVRLLPMVQLWRDLPQAKLDVTSLGHWSGTGLLWTA